MEGYSFIFMSALFGILLFIILWQTSRKFRYSIRYGTEPQDNYWVKAGEYLFLLVAPIAGFIRYQSFETTGEVVFSKTHLPTLLFMAAIGGLSFWVSKFFKRETPPWLNIVLPLGLMQGILLNIALTIHFGKYIVLGAVFPAYGFELVAPLINILFLTRELYHNHLVFQYRFKTEPIASRNYIVLGLYILMDKSFAYKLRLFMLLLIPGLIYQIMLLMLAGQSPDAIIQVFTNTKGFTFSNPGKNTLDLFIGVLR